MKLRKVAVYVQRRYAKPAYKIESYDVRAWPGLEMVCDVLRRAGIKVEYCSSATVARYRVVLVSITAGCDWYPFIRERQRWKKCGTVIVGGAGVLNVRPFLPYADIFCLGRAEDYIVQLVEAALRGEKYTDPSVCYAAEFSMRRRYRIRSAKKVYPHEVRLANGKQWREAAIGCQRRCLFCGYTWHRKHLGGLQGDSGAGRTLWPAGREKTMFELDLEDPDSWDLGHLRMVGLDGFSERLRRMVKKPITREMLKAFLRGLGRSGRAGRLKVYNIVGLPTETEDDWMEFAEDFRAADRSLRRGGKRWGIILHNTPFRAMPATPAAIWPMAYENFRQKIGKRLSQGQRVRGTIFYEGKQLWGVESEGTESLPTVILEALALRGTEADSEMVGRLAASRKLSNANTARRTAILERHLDVGRLFRAYTWRDLPTRYLRSYAKVDFGRVPGG